MEYDKGSLGTSDISHNWKPRDSLSHSWIWGSMVSLIPSVGSAFFYFDSVLSEALLKDGDITSVAPIHASPLNNLRERKRFLCFALA